MSSRLDFCSNQGHHVQLETLQGWARPHLALSQTNVIWDLAWPGLWWYLPSSSGCSPEWVSGEIASCHLREKKYRTEPHQVSVNATHIPALVRHLIYLTLSTN